MFQIILKLRISVLNHWGNENAAHKADKGDCNTFLQRSDPREESFCDSVRKRKITMWRTRRRPSIFTPHGYYDNQINLLPGLRFTSHLGNVT